MPNYISGNQRHIPFENHEHLVNFLCKNHTRTGSLWNKHIVTTAQSFIKKKKYTRLHPHFETISKKEPYLISRDVLREVKQKQRSKSYVGDGIISAMNTIGHTLLNFTGLPALKEYFESGREKKTMTEKDKLFAMALNDTYKNIDEREQSIHLGGETLKRIPSYDTDRYSVWQEDDGEYLISVHGTTLGTDLWSDTKILAGNTSVSESDLNDLLTTLDNQNITYDIAGHSLGTSLIHNALQEDEKHNVDEVFMFNPASSAFQSSDYLREEGNRTNYNYYINPSDVVSHGLYQQMSNETIKNNTVLGSYKFSPLAAHSMDQWMDD